MATIIPQPKIDLVLMFTIDESEARALDALVGYGDDAFIKAFKEKLGAAYLEGHESGLKNFFRSIRQHLPQYLSRLNSARRAFEE